MEINATLIVQAVFFCLLLAWLSNVLFKPMLALFDEREKRIEGAKAEAERLDAEARKQMQHVEAQIKIAYDDAKLVKNKLSAEADEARKTALEAARQESNAYLKQAQAELAAITSQVAEELKLSVGPLSEALMQKLGVSQKFPKTKVENSQNMGELGA